MLYRNILLTNDNVENYCFFNKLIIHIFGQMIIECTFQFNIPADLCFLRDYYIFVQVHAVNVVNSTALQGSDMRAPIVSGQAKYLDLLARYHVLKRQHLLAAHVLYRLAERPCTDTEEAPTLHQRSVGDKFKLYPLQVPKLQILEHFLGIFYNDS